MITPIAAPGVSSRLVAPPVNKFSVGILIMLSVAATLSFCGPSLPAAVEIRRLPASDARQGVAADQRYVYAIDNRAISQLDKDTGQIIARWEGDPARFKHLNSCIVRDGALICAASNYPDTPMASRIETFATRGLNHLNTRDLGAGHGSLTWLDRHDGSWWACFANYDGKGGVPGRDHRATTLVRYDDSFREMSRWTFPDTVLDRFAPRSSSGGVWGDDGLLYVTGHDRAELYVMRLPTRGGVLEHVSTLATPTGGQAIGWDPGQHRLLWSVHRRTHQIVASRVPELTKRY